MLPREGPTPRIAPAQTLAPTNRIVSDELLIPDPRGALTPAEQIESRLVEYLSRGRLVASALRTAPVRTR